MHICTDIRFTAQKMKFYRHVFLQQMRRNPQETLDLVSFTEEGKRHFCAVIFCQFYFKLTMWTNSTQQYILVMLEEWKNFVFKSDVFGA